MPRGKKGPIPDSLEDLSTDPTAEEIVGKENVVDVGAVDGADKWQRWLVGSDNAYKCDYCIFTSKTLSEIQEHCNVTGHGGTDEEAVQPELFRPPGVITSMVNVMLPAELLNEKRIRLSGLYQSALEIKEDKKETDSDFNARLKTIDEQMQEIARVLKTPFTYEKVDCEWRIIEGENARGLYRLDTGEQIDKQPLTMEDRVEELQKAETDNSTETPAADGSAAEAVTA